MVVVTMVAVAVVTMMVPMVGPSLVTLGECHSCLRLGLGASKGDSHGLTHFFIYVHILFSKHMHAHINLVRSFRHWLVDGEQHGFTGARVVMTTYEHRAQLFYLFPLTN